MKTDVRQGVPWLTCGVDWASLTLQGERGDYVSWCSDAFEWVMSGQEKGNRGRSVSLQGYKGVMVGSRFFGLREHDAMLRVSGGDSWAGFQGFYRPDCGVSRLDLQTTIRVGPDNTGYYIKRAYAKAKEDIDTGAIASKLCRLNMDNKRGLTCYIGSKKSLVYIRIYDKGAESKTENYLGCVRYEVEYHNEASRAMARGLMTDNGRNAATKVVDTVAHELSKRGVEVPFVFDGGAEVVFKTEQKETDAERSLAWLRAQVRPTVQWLYEIGKAQDVTDALGLEGWEWSKVLQGLTEEEE